MVAGVDSTPAQLITHLRGSHLQVRPPATNVPEVGSGWEGDDLSVVAVQG
jgi:hypothetical protein